jgi:CBS domain-containing protein
MQGNVGQVLDRKGRTVWSIAPDATVFSAIEQMAHHRIGALPVVAGGLLLGVVSERDYARRVILEGRSSRDTRVEEIMTTPVTTVTESATVEEALRLMTERRIRHLPVVQGGNLVGMISIGDLVGWIINAQQEQISRLESYISGSYPA